MMDSSLAPLLAKYTQNFSNFNVLILKTIQFENKTIEHLETLEVINRSPTFIEKLKINLFFVLNLISKRK